MDESSPVGSRVVHGCVLCPRACGADRASGTAGVCGANDELVVARAALHLWEEPPISGTQGSGTVFFSHCPLRCIYCQNESIAAGQAGKAISIERLAEIFLELEAQGAHNVNLVTPTHYAPQIRAAVARARAAGLGVPVVYNTSGYERVDAVRDLADTVDVYLTDFKYWSEEPARAYSNAPDYRELAWEAVAEMVRQTGSPVFDEEGMLVRGTVVRHMMLPGMLADSKAIVAALFEAYGTDILLSLMNQYTPLRPHPGHPELDAAVDGREYEELLEFADSLGIEDYFWQEGSAVGESFIPAFDATGV